MLQWAPGQESFCFCRVAELMLCVHQANGAFVAAGSVHRFVLLMDANILHRPPGFTALALINLGEAARDILPLYDLVSPQAGEIFYAGSVVAGLLLYGMAIFLFVFGAMPYWFKVHKHLYVSFPFYSRESADS